MFPCFPALSSFIWQSKQGGRFQLSFIGLRDFGRRVKRKDAHEPLTRRDAREYRVGSSFPFWMGGIVIQSEGRGTQEHSVFSVLFCCSDPVRASINIGWLTCGNFNSPQKRWRNYVDILNTWPPDTWQLEVVSRQSVVRAHRENSSVRSLCATDVGILIAPNSAQVVIFSARTQVRWKMTFHSVTHSRTPTNKEPYRHHHHQSAKTVFSDSSSFSSPPQWGMLCGTNGDRDEGIASSGPWKVP